LKIFKLSRKSKSSSLNLKCLRSFKKGSSPAKLLFQKGLFQNKLEPLLIRIDLKIIPEKKEETYD